jgi:hypothetical protein
VADYAFEGPKWDSRIVTWSFAATTFDAAHPYSDPIGAPFQDVIRQAFATWAAFAGLTFVEVSDANPVDIRIGFADLISSGKIGETFFHSSQGAFAPSVAVRLEDPAETPIVNAGGTYQYSGYLSTLAQVAVHEIGHALGLDHSTDSHAVMYPVAGLSNRGLDGSDILGIETLYANFLIAVVDTTTGQGVAAAAHPYTGPVSGLQNEYINLTSDSLNATAASPGWFIHGGSGNDAIAVTSGTNVLDGGTGSNFLTGGSGTDTFFVDDRSAMADIWSTVDNFHVGDAATIWGVTPQDFNLSWVDGQGAAGFTGVTLHASSEGKPTASLTLAGFSQADMASGRLSVSYGTDTASGSAYAYVHEDS